MKNAFLVATICSLVAACGSTTADSDSTAPEAEEQATPVAHPARPSGKTAGNGAGYNFSLQDTEGQTHDLASYNGKVVVVEWFNPGCPFVKYAYGQGPLKTMAGAEMAKGDTVWLAVNSGAAGKQGHGLEQNKSARTTWQMKHPILLDGDGAVARQLGAKTTPHMFVFGKDGSMVYKGALDNAPLGKGQGEYQNYVAAALTAARAGKKPEVQETVSYGCGVKY